MPSEVVDGIAKHCSFAGQRPCEVSNCPFTQVATIPRKQVVSPSIAQSKKINNNHLRNVRLAVLTIARTCSSVSCLKLRIKVLGLQGIVEKSCGIDRWRRGRVNECC